MAARAAEGWAVAARARAVEGWAVAAKVAAKAITTFMCVTNTRLLQGGCVET